jgi:hypothetical protein
VSGLHRHPREMTRGAVQSQQRLTSTAWAMTRFVCGMCEPYMLVMLGSSASSSSWRTSACWLLVALWRPLCLLV